MQFRRSQICNGALMRVRILSSSVKCNVASYADIFLARHGEERLRDEPKERLRRRLSVTMIRILSTAGVSATGEPIIKALKLKIKF